ncbi:MAG: lactonase family protein [Verrucomicrobiota bacterium]
MRLLQVLALLFLTIQAQSQQLVYFGTYTSGKSKSEGSYQAWFDESTGTRSAPKLAAELENPSFLAAHPELPLLFAVLEVEDFDSTGGAVAAFKINHVTGELTHLNTQKSGGAHPCHISIDHSGQVALVTNYSTGTVSNFQIQEDGSLTEAVSVVQHSGSSVHPKRQLGPHAHSIYPGPANKSIYAIDLGTDEIIQYALDSTGQLEETATTKLSPGTGPRHMAFHPKGKFAYSINELVNTISTYSITPETGKLTYVDSISTLPADFSGRNSTAEVVIHPSGKFLYGSNRGHDSIAVFQIDPADGRLDPVQKFEIEGKIPRNFDLDLSGRFLLVAGQRSSTVEILKINEMDGTLTAVGDPISLPTPVCIVTVDRK